MRDYGPAVKWYRNCIHQKQRTVNTLSIEVGLEAQDNQNPGSLAETMECLDTAIAILEQAKAAGNVTAEARDAQSEAELVSPPQQLMDDLGHSMAPIDLTPSDCRLAVSERGGPSQLLDTLKPSAFDWHTVVYDDSLWFFG